MSQAYPNRGRNPSTGDLPNVGGGEPIKASQINSISTGIDRATIRSGVGYTIASQGSGGTSLRIDNKTSSHPWKCVRHGGGIMVTRGNAWGRGMQERFSQSLVGLQKYYSNSNKYWSGKPVLIDIAGVEFASFDAVLDDRQMALPDKAGYYYIEYCKYEGANHSGAESDALKGTKQFVLKWSATPPTSDKNWYVLCHIDAKGVLIQGITGDIFGGITLDEITHPFKVTTYTKAGATVVDVAFGTVNNKIPKYSDDNKDVGTVTSALEGLGTAGSETVGTWSVYLTIVGTKSGNNWTVPDPAQLKVYMLNNWTMPASSSTTAYVLIANIVVAVSGTSRSITINQAVSGSLWAERFQCGKDLVQWWVAKI